MAEFRAEVHDAIERLGRADRSFRDAAIEIVRWDDPNNPAALDAYLSPQDAINRGLPKPSECDVVVVMLWSRMGMPLEHGGRRYLSGTHYEFEDAVSAEKPPRVFVYRWTAPVEDAWTSNRFNETSDQQQAQLKALNEFLSGFSNPDGSIKGSVMRGDANRLYTTPDVTSFRELVVQHVGNALKQVLDDWRTGQGDLGIARTFQFKLENFRREYLDSETGRVPFGGRDNELIRLNSWLGDAEAPPRFLITAPAGRGKSALIVHWVHQLELARLRELSDWQIAFMPISIRAETNRPEVYYQGLALRLAEISGLELEQTVMPGADHYRAQVRRQFNHLAEKGTKVIVVIDGVDEALERTFDANIIPPEPPATLRVLISARLQLGDTDANGWLTRLSWDRNVRVATMELDRLGREEIADVMVRQGAPLDVAVTEPGLVERLTTLTEGEPLLIRYYVEDLWAQAKTGARITRADLETLKPGFNAYFERWMEQQEQLWHQEGAASVAEKVDAALLVLAHAMGPLQAGDLTELMRRVRDDRAIGFDPVRMLRPLRRFVMGDGRDSGFVLSHPKIGDYLRAERFHHLDRDLQKIYADWGRQHLADLNATPPRTRPEEASRYLLTYLAKHLEADADRPAADFMPLVEDGWRRAKERLSATGGFAADVRAAWDACRREGPVAHIGDQWRCVLTLSSIQSLGQNIPGALLVQLVRHGQLSASEARHFLELKGAKAEAVTALAEIAVLLAERDEARPAQEFYGATLELAARESDIWSHCKLLGWALDTLGDLALWGQLAERRRRALAEALAAARAIGDEWRRARALAAVAERLTDPAQRTPVLAEALAAARAIGDEGYRAEALAAVAERLTDPAQRTPVLAEALAAARAIGDEWRRARALAAVAERLTDPAQRTPVLAEALAAARAIGDEWRRARALAAVARRLTDLPVADLSPLAVALLDAAPGLSRPRCLEVVKQAAALTAAIGGEDAAARLARAIRDTAAWYP